MQLTHTHRHTSTHLVTESPRLSATLAAITIVAALFGVLALDTSTASTPVQHLYYLPIVFAGVTWTTLRSVESAAMGEQLFRAADMALYAAKNGGRNRISVAAPLHAPLAGRRARRPEHRSPRRLRD